MTAVLWQCSWEERGSVSRASARRQNKSLLIPPDRMEPAGDFSMTIPLIVTALAVILATLIVKLRAAKEKKPTEAAAAAQVVEKEETLAEEPSETEEIDKEEPIEEDEAGERTESDGAISVEEVGTVEAATAKERETEVEECAAKERTPSSHSSQDEEDSKEEDFETESDKVLKISEADDAGDVAFKYLPGKLRGSDFEKMLTKDELEEEQRAEDDMKLSLQSS